MLDDRLVDIMQYKILVCLLDIFESKANWHFRSASYEIPQNFSNFCLSKESKDQSNVIFAFTLVSGINHHNE